MKFYYLFRFQYLGFRYHGWLKQTSKKTIQGAIEEALQLVLIPASFQVLGASRTDSMVSSSESFFELITDSEIIDLKKIVKIINENLPPDIKILDVKETNQEFKIISASKSKEYHYYFSFGEKLHPFCAPFMAMINEDLDIDLMIKAARLFEGEHNFAAFCYRLKDTQSPMRKIDFASLEINNELTGNFFPAKSFVFKVRAKSFLRHQIRLMMGALFFVGMKRLSLLDLKAMLAGNTQHKLMTTPASGLVLKEIQFSDS